MSGIAGFCDYCDNLTEEAPLWGALVKRMCNKLCHRGFAGTQARVSAHTALGYAALDGMEENSPSAEGKRGEGRVSAILDGKLRNAAELKRELQSLGCRFQTGSDAELLLWCYLQFGYFCAEKLSGAFAFVIEDEALGCTFLCRDQLGLKPLYYANPGDRLVFGSETKALFEYPGILPSLDTGGLQELFLLGPARLPGSGVFSGIREVKPGHSLLYTENGLREFPYYELEAHPHQDGYDATVGRIQELINESAGRCSGLFSPGCLLSKEETSLFGDLLPVFSPQEQPEIHLTDLYDAAIAWDLPGDFCDPLLFARCQEISGKYRSALSSAGLAELFAACPWFREQEQELGGEFPWHRALPSLESFLKPELAETAPSFSCGTELRLPSLSGETPLKEYRRKVYYLTLTQYLPGLYSRLDAIAASAGLELEFPLADSKLAEYLFNVPLEYWSRGGRSNALFQDIFPSVPLPAPKLPCAEYRHQVWKRYRSMAADTEEPIHSLASAKTMGRLEPDGGWERFWQASRLLQINFWLKRYDVELPF